MTSPFIMEKACPKMTTIRRAGQGIAPAPSGVSNGSFLVQMLLSSMTDGEFTAMRVSMEPTIISHWHSHPCGQLLFVLDGKGLVQRAGGSVEEVQTGDAIWFPPDERHWHGANTDSSFSYLSVQAIKNGTSVHWMEPVDKRGSNL